MLRHSVRTYFVFQVLVYAIRAIATTAIAEASIPMEEQVLSLLLVAEVCGTMCFTQVQLP